MNSANSLAFLIAFIDLLWLFALIGVPALMSATLLGVYVPKEERDIPQVARIRRSFLLLGSGSALLGGIFSILAYFLSKGSEGWTLALLLIPQALGLFVAWNFSRRQALALKAERGWKIPQSSKRTAYIGSDRESAATGVSAWAYLLHILIILITVALVALNWDRIPNPLPVHFDAAGLPDRYAEKSIGSVYALTILQSLLTALFAGIHFSLRRMRQSLDPSDPQGSLRRQIQLRASNSWMLFLISLIVTVMFSWLQVRSTYDFRGTLPIGLAMAFLLLLMIPIVGFMIYIRRRGLEDEGINRRHGEDRFWRGGMFYFNPQDPGLFAEKRTGFGWTFNFARPIVWLLTASIVLLPVAAIIATALLAG